MTEEMTVEKFEELTKQLENINGSIAKLEGAKEEKMKQLAAILAKYKDKGVKNLSDLKKLAESSKKEADTLGKEIQDYVTAAGEKLKQVDSLLSQ